MPLPIHLVIHFLLALFAGYIVWKLFGQYIYSFLGGVLGGFLIDLDHLIDYVMVFGLNFSFQSFFDGDQFDQSGKIYILFHGWEYVVLLSVLALFVKSKKIKALIFALALGMFFHLSTDVAVNHLSVQTYSIYNRTVSSFGHIQINK